MHELRYRAMRDWASGGGTKLERAKEHIADFARSRREFLDVHPFIATSRFDSKRKQIFFIVSTSPEIPARFASITSDAIHNLRAS
jgi:hypothetical protein